MTLFENCDLARVRVKVSITVSKFAKWHIDIA